MKQRKLIGQERGLVVIYYTGGTLSIKVPFGPLLFKDELKLPHLPRPQIVLSLLVSLTLSYHFGVQLLVFFAYACCVLFMSSVHFSEQLSMKTEYSLIPVSQA